ncbi:thiamine pyrophosphate-dependent enzyme [Streptomyces sp. NPDC054783]
MRARRSPPGSAPKAAGRRARSPELEERSPVTVPPGEVGEAPHYGRPLRQYGPRGVPVRARRHAAEPPFSTLTGCGPGPDTDSRVSRVQSRRPSPPEGRYPHLTGFGTLGYALPAALGSEVAEPHRQVLALNGDGGLQFTVQEPATAAQLRLPLPIVVFDNSGYGGIRGEMRARGDAPAAVDLAPVDLPALARAYGGHGTRACDPAALARAVTEALDRPGPTLITVPEEIP